MVRNLTPGVPMVVLLPSTRHALAAANTSGDFWEQSLDLTGKSEFSLAISLVQVREALAKVEASVRALTKEIETTAEDLKRAESRNDVLRKDPKLVARLRQEIVGTIRSYQDIYQRERNARSHFENEAITLLSDPVAPGESKELRLAIGMVQAIRGGRHQILEEGLARSLKRLGAALDNPIDAIDDLEKPDFTKVTHTVFKGEEHVELSIARDKLSFRNLSSGDAKSKTSSPSPQTIPCASIKKVKPAFGLGRALVGRKNICFVDIHSTLGKFHLGVTNSSNPPCGPVMFAILGDLYLSCPSLIK